MGLLPVICTGAGSVLGYFLVQFQNTVIFWMAPDDLPLFQQQHHPQANIDKWRTDLSDPYLSEEGKQELTARLKKQGAQFRSIIHGRYGGGLHQMQILIDTSDPEQYPVYYSNSYGD